MFKDGSFLFRAVVFLGLTKSFHGPKYPEHRLCSSHWGLRGWLSFNLALASMLYSVSQAQF